MLDDSEPPDQQVASLPDDPMPDAVARRLAGVLAALDAERTASKAKPAASEPGLKSFGAERAPRCATH